MEEKPCEFSMEVFTILNELGEGSYGKVVLASHPSFQQKLAVKIVKPERFEGFQIPERYILETLRNHPYITHLYGTFQTETDLFLVTEFVSGGNLRKLIETSSPFGYDMIRYITAEIVCGLQFIHSHEIIHRDLTPENILLDSEGHIKIAGFGVSQTEVTETRKMRGVAGTAAYMAPEVMEEKEYNISADYYSLGVILYEMAVSPDHFRKIKENQSESLLEIVFSELDIAPDRIIRELIVLLLWEDIDIRTYLVRNIRRNTFFEWTEWDKVEKRQSPPVFKPESTLTEPEYYSMTVEEFMANQSHPEYGDSYMISEEFNEKSEDCDVHTEASPACDVHTEASPACDVHTEASPACDVHTEASPACDVHTEASPACNVHTEASPACDVHTEASPVCDVHTEASPACDVHTETPPACDVHTETSLACDKDGGKVTTKDRHILVVGDSVIGRIQRAIFHKEHYRQTVCCLPGARVRHIADCMDRLLDGAGEDPAVMVYIGTNDKVRERWSTLQNDFKDLGAIMKKRSPKAIFSEILPAPRATPQRQQELMVLNKWLRNWCREEGFGFMANWTDFSGRYHLYSSNGLHLNGRGAAFLGLKMAKMLEENFN